MKGCPLTALDVCSALAAFPPIPSKLRTQYADVLARFADKLRREGLESVAPLATALANELRNRNLSPAFEAQLLPVRAAAQKFYALDLLR